ncbi:protein containing CinA, partial [mine drainage metagenome]
RAGLSAGTPAIPMRRRSATWGCASARSRSTAPSAKPPCGKWSNGALARSGADVAVAVSGIAGPEGGAPDKPVGTCGSPWRCVLGRNGSASGAASRVAVMPFAARRWLTPCDEPWRCSRRESRPPQRSAHDDQEVRGLSGAEPRSPAPPRERTRRLFLALWPDAAMREQLAHAVRKGVRGSGGRRVPRGQLPHHSGVQSGRYPEGRVAELGAVVRAVTG